MKKALWPKHLNEYKEFSYYFIKIKIIILILMQYKYYIEMKTQLINAKYFF